MNAIIDFIRNIVSVVKDNIRSIFAFICNIISSVINEIRNIDSIFKLIEVLERPITIITILLLFAYVIISFGFSLDK